MLQFYSANVRGANTERAVDECVRAAFGGAVPGDLRVLAVLATLGHKLEKIDAILRARFPGVAVVGATCGGVIGPAGPGESMNELALFAVSGPAAEASVAAVDDVTHENSYEKMVELAKALHADPASTPAVFAITPGFDCACDQVVRGFGAVMPPSVHLFGGLSSDNMKGLVSYQLHDGKVVEKAIWAVAFSDPTLRCISRATHGFSVIGEEMEITKTQGVVIQELDGRPALEAYGERFQIAEDTIATDMMPFGALAYRLPEENWAEYGSEYMLTGLAGQGEGGSLIYRLHLEPGTKLRFAVRDEVKIFAEMRRVLDEMKADMAGGKVVAVLQADCVARGRFSLNAIMKDELIGMIQEDLSGGGETCPWMGMYGFGEFAQVGGRNAFHTFTTALLALYRKD